MVHFSFTSPYEGEKDTNKQQKNLKHTYSSGWCHLLSQQWWQTGNQSALPSQQTPPPNAMEVHTHSSACPMTSMALLEPSCSPGTALPSQQCSNSLLKQKDMASLGVIKPIKNHLGLIYALLNHMIEILWSAVSQHLGRPDQLFPQHLSERCLCVVYVCTSAVR